jgi:hypothetical protein
MGQELIKSPRQPLTRGLLPAVASGVVPGLGQLVNRDIEKAIGVFAVCAVTGASLLGALPLVGTVVKAVWGITWGYGVIDGYLSGRKKAREK